MKQIEPGEPARKASYARTIFFRGKCIQGDVSVLDWIKITVLEVLFGEEILEQLVVTSAYNESEKSKLGNLLHLSDLVPSGIFTNYFRPSLYQLLYYKYYLHYLFLEPEAEFNPTTRMNEREDTLSLERDRFGMRHGLLYQVISFQRVYIVTWVLMGQIRKTEKIVP